MKYKLRLTYLRALMSLPARGAWIEMPEPLAASCAFSSLPARGAWIEIKRTSKATTAAWRSLPARGAWIEMPEPLAASCAFSSLPARGAWIEIKRTSKATTAAWRSLPARGAWIEIISKSSLTKRQTGRSPHGERGLKWFALPIHGDIASLPARGAWIEMYAMSLTVIRGAWIEISDNRNSHTLTGRRPPHGGRGLKLVRVAGKQLLDDSRPPHGGRGLKLTFSVLYHVAPCGSPPARGAWIEIYNRHCTSCGLPGRPPHGGRGLKYTVDMLNYCRTSRPPHGGRGLKYRQGAPAGNSKVSPPARGAWIEIRHRKFA